MEDKEINLSNNKQDTNLSNNMKVGKLNLISRIDAGFNFNNQEREIEESFKDLDLKIAIIKEKTSSIIKNIKTAK